MGTIHLIVGAIVTGLIYELYTVARRCIRASVKGGQVVRSIDLCLGHLLVALIAPLPPPRETGGDLIGPDEAAGPLSERWTVLLSGPGAIGLLGWAVIAKAALFGAVGNGIPDSFWLSELALGAAIVVVGRRVLTGARWPWIVAAAASLLFGATAWVTDPRVTDPRHEIVWAGSGYLFGLSMVVVTLGLLWRGAIPSSARAWMMVTAGCAGAGTSNLADVFNDDAPMNSIQVSLIVMALVELYTVVRMYLSTEGRKPATEVRA